MTKHSRICGDNHSVVLSTSDYAVGLKRKQANAYHCCRALVSKIIIIPFWVHSTENPADMFTKSLGPKAITIPKKVIFGVIPHSVVGKKRKRGDPKSE